MPPSAIDIHHHYLPSSLLDEARARGKHLGVELIERDGQTSISFAGGSPHVIHPALPKVEERLEMMGESKLAMATLGAHTSSLGYRLTGEQGENWCQAYNEGIKELVSRHPDRFVGMASVPLQDPRRAADVLETAVRDLGLSGGYIATNVNGTYYDSTDFDPFWAKAQELDVMIVMHPETVAGEDRMGPYGLKIICGNPADTALSYGYLTYSGVLDRFPKLKICILHGGGFVPYQLGRFDEGWRVHTGARAPQAKHPPSHYRENIYYDNLVHRVDAIEFLKGLVGHRHILVGTDYPFDQGDFKAVEKIEALSCPDSDKQAMLEGNARRLLKI